MVANYDE